MGHLPIFGPILIGPFLLNRCHGYASAVTSSCSFALAPRKNEAAVEKVADKEENSRNVFVYSLVETAQKDIFTKIPTFLSDIDKKLVIIS